MTQGIYKLTNNKSNEVYIGQSINIEQRFKEHVNGLKNNKHHAYKLQKFYNKHKQTQSFKVSYEILETVSNPAHLNARELYYIDKYDSHINGYNSIGTSGSPIQTKKKERQNKKISKTNSNKNEFELLVNKYHNNLYLQYGGYSDTYLHRVNEAIRYFVSNYNLDLYMAEISQYKYDVTLFIIDRNFKTVQRYEYITKYQCMGIGINTFMYQGSYTNAEWNYNRYKKFYNITQSKNRYKWFLKRLVNLDSEIIQYNILKYSPNKYRIKYKDIHQIIGYEYGSSFKKHIVEDKEIQKISKEIGATYPHGAIEIYIPPIQ